ncbi:MAG TPA: ATP-binding protein [Pyrinomonadaceae bacterium]|nr:ATP-binding protein [Pyrinomonadaceae bacterium]
MSEQLEETATAREPFGDLRPTPESHFKLYFYAAVLHVVREVASLFGSHEAAVKQFPFLQGYSAELSSRLSNNAGGAGDAEWWREELLAWEGTAEVYLPLRELREAAGLGHDALTLLTFVGLCEEDPRFGLLFEAVQGGRGQQQPTLGLIAAWWESAEGGSGAARRNLRRLQELGLVQFGETASPRMSWTLQATGLLWDALRGAGEEVFAPWLEYRPPEALCPREELVVGEEVARMLSTVPALMESGEVGTLVVRGPRHNGRRTLVGAIARSLGRGLLEVKGFGRECSSGQSRVADERWQTAGTLATLLNAVPVVALDLGPGETAELPRLAGYKGAVGVCMEQQGGVTGQGVERALTVTLEMPGPSARRELWRRSAGEGDAAEISDAFRMTTGNIHSAAALAKSYAALDGRERISPADVQKASRALNRQALDTLATRVRTHGDWSQLAVGADTLSELTVLESRCRHRERIRGVVGENLGAQLNAGVRALLTGPSGTGKTLAARALAASLRMDLYRLDLSTVVNKYIGETEKNLSQIFSRAEELDVILLIDEGDSLLTQRTGVQTSNDRYANLETNYLLQRIETYEGIVLVTTNAGDRIDSAFRRRMDVIIDFRAPEAAERWMIWQIHLPGSHAVAPELLDEVAFRCALTGGQIRNAVLHASLLALGGGGALSSEHLVEAVKREYRKSGAVCPLRNV